jgi:hypothetical protein
MIKTICPPRLHKCGVAILPTQKPLLNSFHNYFLFNRFATKSGGNSKLVPGFGWLAPVLRGFNRVRSRGSTPWRRHAFRQLLLSSLFSFSPLLWAQQNIDVGLSFEYQPSNQVRVGEVIEVRFVVTNYSTVPVEGALKVDNTYIDPDIAIRDEFNAISAIGDTCQLDFTCGNSCFQVGTIPVGESRFCSVKLRAIRKVQTPDKSRWIAATFGSAPDSNPANNIGILEVSIAETVQAPLSIASYLTITLLVLGLGMFAARRA